MKYEKDYIKQLDERYKSTVDDGLWETWVSMYEVFDPDSDSLVYAVLATRTFKDGVETYDKGREGKIFTTLEAAQEYFKAKTIGMYKSPEEELLVMLNCLKPKEIN